MLIILQNSLLWSSSHVTDSKQSRQHFAITNKAGKYPVPETTAAKDPIEASIEEENQQHDHAPGHQASGSKKEEDDLDHKRHKTRDQPLEETPQATTLEGNPNSLLGQSPPEEGKFREYPEVGRGMIPQLYAEPISHNQLVVEVKGTYAVVAVVEAKCIEIDERQLAAAQEKDPHRRTNLKIDQWQALTALHKQVLRLSRTHSSITY